MAVRTHSLFDREIIAQAVVDSFKKLNPLSLLKNPVIFVTEVGAALTTLGLFFRSGDEPVWLCPAGNPLALVHRALCQFCRGHG